MDFRIHSQQGFNMILKLLRNALGMVIVFGSYATLPKQTQRTPEEQKKADKETDSLKLYQLYACPFCVKTRRAIHRLNLNIEYRGVQQGGEFREELEKEAGRIQAPCLRIENEDGTEWMYESSDIIEYLDKRFSA